MKVFTGEKKKIISHISLHKILFSLHVISPLPSYMAHSPYHLERESAVDLFQRPFLLKYQGRGFGLTLLSFLFTTYNSSFLHVFSVSTIVFKELKTNCKSGNNCIIMRANITVYTSNTNITNLAEGGTRNSLYGVQ